MFSFAFSDLESGVEKNCCILQKKCDEKLFFKKSAFLFP